MVMNNERRDDERWGEIAEIMKIKQKQKKSFSNKKFPRVLKRISFALSDVNEITGNRLSRIINTYANNFSRIFKQERVNNSPLTFPVLFLDGKFVHYICITANSLSSWQLNESVDSKD